MVTKITPIPNLDTGTITVDNKEYYTDNKLPVLVTHSLLSKSSQIIQISRKTPFLI